MEIINISRIADSVISENLKAKYNILSLPEETIISVSGSVEKDGLIKGFFNSNNNGVFNISFTEDNQLTKNELKKIFNNIIDDILDLYSNN
jgi:glutathionyl-hydroquinone reductase